MITLSKSKKISLVILLLLALWFMLDITGFSVNDFTLVVSAFIDEPIDIAFFFIFIASIFVYIRFERWGKWIVLAILAIWAAMQGSMYLSDDIENYYNFFSQEGTHRLFPASDAFLIKDTYHIVLDVLIAASLISVMFSIAAGIAAKHKEKSGNVALR
jgi:hypothetical protein